MVSVEDLVAVLRSAITWGYNLLHRIACDNGLVTNWWTLPSSSRVEPPRRLPPSPDGSSGWLGVCWRRSGGLPRGDLPAAAASPPSLACCRFSTSVATMPHR